MKTLGMKTLQTSTALFSFLGFLCVIVSPVSQAGDTTSVAVKTAVVVEKQIGETLVAYGVIDPDPDQVLSLSHPTRA